jgi:hypothetical protein
MKVALHAGFLVAKADALTAVQVPGGIELRDENDAPITLVPDADAVQIIDVGTPPKGDLAWWGEVVVLQGGDPMHAWRGGEWQPLRDPAAAQFQRDEARYRRRAAVKDELLSFMAADNMSRVRSGVWTVADLTGLLADPDVAAATQFMGTLSYELAAQAIASATTPLLTPTIRADWIGKLQAHFYLEG